MSRKHSRGVCIVILCLVLTGLALNALASDGFESLGEVTGEDMARASGEPGGEVFSELGVDEPKQGETRVVMTFGGDVTLGCTDQQQQSEAGFSRVIERNGFSWPFGAISYILDEDDITLVNFEGTLTESKQKIQKEFNFKGPADYAFILTAGSIEAVNLANNHIMDYGANGKQDTIDALEAVDIVWCGSNHTATMTVNGVKVGFIGNTFPYANGKRDISKDVKALRADGCQIVVASFHWGEEYEKQYGRDQINIGHAAVDAGADIVIGHHPHIIQGIELYKGKYIFYSLGNLCFGGNRDPDDRDSFLARVTFTIDSMSGAVKSSEFVMIPLRVTALDKGTDYRPILATGKTAERIRDRVLNLSKNIDYIVIYR